MGETRVDLLHLLEDLRDAYPGSLEETILTEIIANSLDSEATHITLHTDRSAATLTAVDDGRGMARRELARYHDLATSTKERGRGIGFAGVGIKLGLLACHQVVTETRHGKTHVATAWHLKSRRRAPWQWIEPPGLVGERGTAVRLLLADPLSPLLESGFLETAIRRHFEPLLDPAFDAILEPVYPRGVGFTVDGLPVRRELAPVGERAPLGIRLARRRKPSASGYLERADFPLPEEDRGVAISTLGKVIKRGWDWLGLSPAASDLLSGLIEAPALAESLTLSKADFIRTGPRGAAYLAYRKAIQEVVADQLALWGDRREGDGDATRKKLRPIERDLRNLLPDLAKRFPLLATLVDRRPGGQRNLPLGAGGEPVPMGVSAVPLSETTAETVDVVAEAPKETPPALEVPEEPRPPGFPPGALPGNGPRRPARYGLGIRFETRPGNVELSRLVESTVWVNQAHPAYRRAVAARSEGYHLALAVALALAPLAVEPSGAHEFVTTFLARWGEVGGRTRGGRGRSKPR